MGRASAALATVETTPSGGSLRLMPGPPPPDRSWRPPGGRRALALAALVLAGAAGIARFLPAPDPASQEILGAREVDSYELVEGQPLAFALPPGSGELRVLTNLDLASLLPEGVPYAIRVRLPDEGRDETYPLVARPALDAKGERTAFFLRRADSPARTRLVSLARGSALPGTLEIALVGDGHRRASLRVFVAQGRLTPAPPPLRRGPPERGLTIDDLSPEARASFEAQRWSRLATREKTPTRSFFVVAAPAPLAPREDGGEAIGDGHVAAFTVKGPGTVHLEAVAGPLRGRAVLLDARGGERTIALALEDHGRTSVPVGRGLATLRVQAEAPARVRLLAPPALAVRPEQAADPRADEVELTPAWSWEALAVAAGEPAVSVALAGRGGAPFQVSARVPLGPKPVPAAAATLRWRFLDGHGRVVGSGAREVAGTLASEDRLDDGFVGAATRFYLWPPAGAERLVFLAPRPVAVAVASPAFESERSAAEQRGLEKGLVLRHDRPEQPAFQGVRPVNAAELRRAGRLVRLAGAMRLERLPEPAVPDEAATLVPERSGGQFVLLAPVDDPAARGGGLSWAVRPGRDETVTVARPPGASARARVPATLLYDVEHGHGREAATVSVDGKVLLRAAVLGARGQIHLPPLPVGRHQLRVELSAQGQLFLDQAVAGAGIFRRSRVFLFRGGSAAVRVPKGAPPRSLGLVLYTDGPVRGAELEAIVDGGARAGHTAVSATYTRLRRRIPLQFARVDGAHYLNRAGHGVWASESVFVPMGDDLPPGTHVVAVRARGVGAQAMARFFSYGAKVQSRISQHVQVRAEVIE